MTSLATKRKSNSRKTDYHRYLWKRLKGKPTYIDDEGNVFVLDCSGDYIEQKLVARLII